MTHAVAPANPVDTISTNIALEWAKKEPIWIAAAVTWLILQGHNAVVSRFHWFTDAQWTSYSHYAVPILTAAITAVIAWILRKFTAPWLKVKPVLEAKATQIGLDDVSMGYLAANVAKLVQDHVTAITDARAAVAAAPQPSTGGPDGMTAGAPTVSG